MTVGYLISISILLIGIVTALGIYFCSIMFENALLRKREKQLQDSFNRAIKENKLYNWE
jgi:hypothetical protein